MYPQVEEFEHEWREGDREVARTMARDYFADKAELVKILKPKTLEQLVAMVDAYRAAGDEENRIITDMWLLSEFSPQIIGGQLSVGGYRREGGAT